MVAIREVKEESGYEIVIKKLAAVLDRDKHDHPQLAYHVYKLFFIGELCGGQAPTALKQTAPNFSVRMNSSTFADACDSGAN